MMRARISWVWCIVLMVAAPVHSVAQKVDSTHGYVLDAIVVNNVTYGMVYLPEHLCIGKIAPDWLEQKKKQDKLRNDIYKVYPYAMMAASVFNEVNDNLDKIDGRRARKKYLKSVEKRLDGCFKEPLKDLSIEQGHVLVKLIDRQTGRSCFSIIRELKSGFSAVMWQSVGLVFGNNLVRPYDPTGVDQDIEKEVSDLETANAYQFQLYQQQARLQARR